MPGIRITLEEKPIPFREKRPNAWQLYDLHGNVWEWMQDWYASDYYQTESEGEPHGPESGSVRVVRGGSWSIDAEGCRSACRGWRGPGFRDDDLGFRLARDGAWPLDAFTLARQQAAERPVRAESEVERKPVYKAYEGFRDRLKDGSEAPEDGVSARWDLQNGRSSGERQSGERPVHEVTLDAFAIGRYPVTVGEFRRFVARNGLSNRSGTGRWRQVYDVKVGQKADANWRNPYFPQKDDHPVVCISWNDAAAYCEWLSEQTGERYSLPTEAEWEYACRASSETAYCFGDDEKRLGDYAWYSKNSEGKTHPVGQKRANDWGLCDMHGNVWEWVRDWHGAYSKEPQQNPSGPETGFLRVVRGGSWVRGAESCRSAVRYGIDPDVRRHYLGFRLARRV